MVITNIIIIFVATFLGYIIGRFGDYYLNFWLKDPSWAPHHWIYGLLLAIIGLLLLKNSLGLGTFFLGLGLFISDLKDFFDFKIIGADNKTKNTRKFWNID